MPLKKGKSKKAIASRFRELYADNRKKGRARGSKGKLRSKKQIIAIALASKKK